MDNVTHSLFALTLGRTPLGRAGRGTTAALLLASNAPDIDIVATADGAARYLAWHRGPTHGPLGFVGCAVATAGLVWAGRRAIARLAEAPSARRRPAPSGDDSPQTNDASFAMLVAVSLVGVLFHVLMDVPTSYGTRFLSPFDWHWFAVDWMPIVDVYLLVVLVSGLLFARPATAAARRRGAAIALTLMAVNYGLRGYAHHQALVLAPRLFGPTLPQPCEGAPVPARGLDNWPRQTSVKMPPDRRCLVEIAALPTFTSPFRWRIVAQMSNAFEIHDIDLLDSRFRGAETRGDVFWRQVLRYPNAWTPTVERAAMTPLGQLFLGFSRFPAARSATDAHGATTVRFSDVRFVNGPLATDQPAVRVSLFTATIRFDAEGRLISETLGSR